MRRHALALAAWLGLFAPAAGAYPLREIAQGERLPSFTLKDASGAPRSLEAYRGKPLVLLYGRPGQSFSDKALTALTGLHARFSKHGTAFLLLHHKDPEAPKAPPPAAPFPVIEDGDRAVYGAWGLFILPTTVVLDKDLKVRAAYASWRDDLEDEVAATLDALLGIKEAPKAAPARAKTERPEVSLARKLLESGRPEDSLAQLGAILKSPDAGCEALLTAAEAWLRLDKPAEARARAEECLKGEPASAHGALLLGRASALTGDLARAEEWLRKAVTLNPGSQRARYWLGDLYERTGRKDEALDEYRAALDRLLSR